MPLFRDPDTSNSLEDLIRLDYRHCHPGDTLEDLKHRARFSKASLGLLVDWMALAEARSSTACVSAQTTATPETVMTHDHGTPTAAPNEGGPDWRTRITQEIMARTGIDEPMIATLVSAFYARVRLDPILAPIFDKKVKDWDHHIEKLTAFWSSVALMSGRYHGQPMQAHLPLDIDARHFEHWLALFRQTATETCEPAAAAHFIERAERIAQSLELGVAIQNGVMLGKGQRFYR